ncbi:MAG: glycerate kinase [Pseudomonadota bacterium]
MSKPESHLEAIFRAGLSRVDPFQMIMDHVQVRGDILTINFENTSKQMNLAGFSRILVLGAGKATAPMARAFETLLGDRISQGIIAVKYGHTQQLNRIETIESGHPEPDENGVMAAVRLMDLATRADASTLVITLISGGGSALLPLPIGWDINGTPMTLSLSDKQAVTRALLKCGADITEINCVRKHLSGIKGGRFLQKIAPATSLNFILSDVVGDDLSSIASGLTSFDPTTYGDSLAILDRYGIAETIPARALDILRAGERGDVPETLKPGHQSLERSFNILIGTNRLAMGAARDKGLSLGYPVTCLTSRITGEAREVAKFLAGIAVDVAQSDMLVRKPAVILSGGEPVVTLRGKGKGGRNQEMALAFLAEIQRHPELFQGVTFLAASTDGNDGPTDAAGAFASLEILKRSQDKGLSIKDALADNNSYHFFQTIDALFKTGPTNTNVCDLHILLVEGSS